MKIGIFAMAVAISLPLAAHGQPTPTPTPTPDAKQQKEAQAKARYLEGERHYAAGRYELAVKEFEVALELSGRIKLHFNIANCYERAGSYLQAAKSLQTFLDTGKAPDPELLRERIWRLKRRAKERQQRIDRIVGERVKVLLAKERAADKKRAAQEAKAREQRRLAAQRAAKQRARTTHSQRNAYLTLVGGGVAITASLVLAGLSRSARGDAEDSCNQGLCTRDARDALRREDRLALAADVTGLVGLAAAGIGGYLWYRGRRRAERARLQATPVAGPSTVGAVIRLRF